MPELDYIDSRPVYEPDGSVLAAFLEDRSEVAVIVGPIGSGTSTGACFRIYASAREQSPTPKGRPREGKRLTRWAIVRPTYPELLTSTVKTWLHWFPEEIFGPMKRSRPMNHVLNIHDVELDAWFLALDGVDDIEKLRSTEWTGFWNNELEFQSIEIFDEERSRAGRYPAMIDGGPTWYGVIADMNAPPEDHFVARMAGWTEWPEDAPLEKRRKWPDTWKLFRQPPGLIEIKAPDGKVTGYVDNPAAENAKWLPPGYYRNLAAGWSKQLIDNRIMNRITVVASGDPVWPEFDEEVHISKVPLTFVPDREVIVSVDFGRRPCALISQEIGSKIQVQREFRMYAVSASIFAPALKRFLEQNYRGARIVFTGDPKGGDRGQATEHSALEIFQSYGMRVIPARTNDVKTRIEAGAYAFITNRWLIDARGCPTLAAAVRGKYALEKMDGVDPEPQKRGEAAKYSDVADCLQYTAMFLGEGRRMVGLSAQQTRHAARVAIRRSLRRVTA
jgi:hypothetical protein